MKTLRIITLILMALLIKPIGAQVSVNVQVGTPPPWGPVGYADIRYYYIPDLEVYYDIQTANWIYYTNGVWVYRPALPWYYQYYDLYGGYKVVITDYYGDRPYIYYPRHHRKYYKGYHRGYYQPTIGTPPARRKTNTTAPNQIIKRHPSTPAIKGRKTNNSTAPSNVPIPNKTNNRSPRKVNNSTAPSNVPVPRKSNSNYPRKVNNSTAPHNVPVPRNNNANRPGKVNNSTAPRNIVLPDKTRNNTPRKINNSTAPRNVQQPIRNNQGNRQRGNPPHKR